MSTRRKTLCTLSILLSLFALSVLFHYFGIGKLNIAFLGIFMVIIIRLNIFIFTPKKIQDNI